MFSPHADLHLKAADLAMKHTEFFFNKIRSIIGDKDYVAFLRLNISASMLNSINEVFTICSSENSNYLIIKHHIMFGHIFITFFLLKFFY
jgi:hypothetical protein